MQGHVFDLGAHGFEAVLDLHQVGDNILTENFPRDGTEIDAEVFLVLSFQDDDVRSNTYYELMQHQSVRSKADQFLWT